MANYENLIKLAGDYGKDISLRTQEIENALTFLSSYEDYYPYQKNINIIYNYILSLEKIIKDFN